MSALALLGGKPTLSEPLRPYRSIGEGEVKAVERVIRSGCLSGFYGSWCDQFWGGLEVKAFEAEWASRFKVRHAVSVNSACSGLYAAIAAIGISPGDEVIVPPYSMSATVMAPLLYGGIPVFADIEPETFCLDVASVERAISPRTKAILAVNLFGHPARLTELRKLADSRGFFLIEDNAQGPLAAEGGKLAGTIGHIGIFSLNYHKHIHTGEGGFCVTDDDHLAMRLKMIRNHGENVVEALNVTDLTNLVGLNYRMTELSAAIGREQLRKADEHVSARQSLGEALTNGLRDLEGIQVPVVREGCRHVYYLWAARFDEQVVGVPRSVFSKALEAEGFPHGVGYVRPLYMLPAFQRRIAIGSQGFPFNLSDVQYAPGLCPTTERLYEKELLTFEPCAYEVSSGEKGLIVEAFQKVHRGRHELLAAWQAGKISVQ